MINLKTIQSLEKLSLITVTPELSRMIDRSLFWVEKFTRIDTKDVKPLIWPHETDLSKLNHDQVDCRLPLKDLKKHAPSLFEDYVVVGKESWKK